MILVLAGRQYGHITRRQLDELGLSKPTIDERLRSERLIAVHAGVYCVGPVRKDAPARAAAAVLACGPDALLSHASAAGLWGVSRQWPICPEVTTLTHRRRPGITIHRSRTLTGSDRRRRDGIAVTSPARTILDNAPGWSDRQLARAINDLRRPGHLKLPALREVMDRHPSHPGIVRLRPFVQAATGPTRSEFEDAFLAFAQRHGLPTPRTNVKLDGGYEVDAVFDQQKLIVELDSWEFHRDRGAFSTDRERDAHHLEHGYATVRITWERLQDQPAREAARLRRILRRVAVV